MIDQWIKVLHILAVISWMAGLLYLPRLFVYHAGVSSSSETASLFAVMEWRLYRYIMTPAMGVTWITGLWLAWSVFSLQGVWLYLKFVLVIAMSAHHGFQNRWRKALADGTSQKSPRFFRLQNELPTLLMIGIVVFVIIKPF
ncbi:COG1981 Predicted membrane protein [Rhabdaerophilaceae bacterium]